MFAGTKLGRIFSAVVASLFAACSGTSRDATLVLSLSSDAAISDPNAPALGVQLTIGGHAAWFVFDTGAGAHTLASWFVDRAGLQLESADGLTAQDATGTEVAVQRIPAQHAESLDGHRFVVADAIVARFPPHFEEAAVGGLLNPQLLATPERATVLDLRSSELRAEPYAQAVRRLGAVPVASEDLELCTQAEAPVPNLLYALRVRSQNGEAWLKLDTGANITVFRAGSPITQGLPLESGGETMGVAGRRQPYQLAREVRLSFVGHETTLNAHVVESTAEGCGKDGLLGLDALSSCALILGPDSLAFACDP